MPTFRSWSLHGWPLYAWWVSSCALIHIILLIVCNPQYFLAPQSLNYLTIYFEYALTSAITARWFLSLRKTVRDGSNPNSVVSPTYAQNVSKSKRTSAIERGAMSFGLRSNIGPKDAIHGLNGLDQQKKPITGIKIETETYMMSDLADDGTDNSVSGPVKPSSTWYDA